MKSGIVHTQNTLLPCSNQNLFLAMKSPTSVAKKNIFVVTPFNIGSSLVIKTIHAHALGYNLGHNIWNNVKKLGKIV